MTLFYSFVPLLSHPRLPDGVADAPTGMASAEWQTTYSLLALGAEEGSDGLSGSTGLQATCAATTKLSEPPDRCV